MAKALAELISATKCAAGKPADDPSMYQLKSAAKVKEWRDLFYVGTRNLLLKKSSENVLIVFIYCCYYYYYYWTCIFFILGVSKLENTLILKCILFDFTCSQCSLSTTGVSKGGHLFNAALAVEKERPLLVWLTITFSSFSLTGHGDQCDVSVENGEGRGGWSDPRDEGTRSHYWVHQTGADGKSSTRDGALHAYLLKVWGWDTASLQKRAQRGSGISMSIILNGGAICSLSFIISAAPFLLLPSQLLQVFHSSYRGLASRRRQSEKGRRF